MTETNADRRRARAAAAWRADAGLERMRALHQTDPGRFLEVYGPNGLIRVGLYESAADAAGVDIDTEPPEAA